MAKGYTILVEKSYDIVRMNTLIMIINSLEFY